MKRAVVLLGLLLAGAAPERRAPLVPFWAFITESGGAAVHVFDLTQNNFPFFTQLTVGANPRGVVAANSLNRLYVANFTGNSISVIDKTTMSVATTLTFANDLGAPTELLLTPDEQWLFVACRQIAPAAAEVLRISTSTHLIAETVLPPGTNPMFDLAFRPGSDQGGSGVSQLYATQPANNQIVQMRFNGGVAAGVTASSVMTLTNAEWVDVSPDGSKIYVQQTDALATPAPVTAPANDWGVTPPTFSSIGGIAAGGGSGEIYREIKFSRVTSPTMFAYSANDWPIGVGKRLEIIDASANTQIGQSTQVTGGFNPHTVSIDPTDTLLILGPNPGTLQNACEVFDLTTPSSPALLPLSIFGPQLAWRVAFAPPNPVPFISGICPTAGPTAGGTVVRIEGSNFSAGGNVTFGGTNAPVVNVISSTEILATTPAGSFRADVARTNLDLTNFTLYSGWLYTDTPASKSVVVAPGTAAAQYRMVSWPAVVDLAAAKTQFESALGPYDPQVYRVFHYDPARGGYVELPDLPTSYCETTGKALWVLARFGGTVSVTGLDSDATQAGIPITLDPGWNMVSWPYDNAPGPWTLGSFQIDITPDLLQSYEAADPTNPIGNGLLYEWTGSGYVTSNQMEIGKGYWVLNKTSQTAFLRCSPFPGGKPGEPFEKVTKELAPGDPAPPPPPGGTATLEGEHGTAKCAWSAGSDPAFAAMLALLAVVFLARILRGR